MIPPISFADAYLAARTYLFARSRKFPKLSKLLSEENRQVLTIAYAFFRIADDMVDEEHVTLEQFQVWRTQTRRPPEEQSDPILAAWAYMHGKLNQRYAENILDGIEMDIYKSRYDSFDELLRYNYLVSCSVGLMGLPYIGVRPGQHEQAAPYIEKMTMALQMTNLLRDVGADLKDGRIYLPADKLAQFGLTYADIEALRCDARFKNLMRHLISITRQMFVDAWPCLSYLTPIGRLFCGLGIATWDVLLNEIERIDYDVFSTRIRLPGKKMAWLMLTRWPEFVWPRVGPTEETKTVEVGG